MNTIENNKTGTEAETLLRFGSAVGVPRSALAGVEGRIATELDGIPYAVIPDDYTVTSLEHLLQLPARKRGAWKFGDAASFVAYYKQHQLGSVIYGRIDPPRFLAVFDDHREYEPGWRDHTAEYACSLSAEWKTWTGNNKKAMPQEVFAQFIEDNLPDIVEPSAADMLEISRTLEAKTKVNFASGIRLDNGQVDLTYQETIEGTAGKGKLQIPETFAVGIAVLEGGPKYKVTARLRYRIKDGSLALWFDLLRPHKVLEDAVLDIWKQIAEQTGQTILNGDPDLSA